MGCVGDVRLGLVIIYYVPFMCYSRVAKSSFARFGDVSLQYITICTMGTESREEGLCLSLLINVGKHAGKHLGKRSDKQNAKMPHDDM